MIKTLQRMMEDNEVFIKIIPTEDGINILVCENECASNESYKLNNKLDFSHELQKILELW